LPSYTDPLDRALCTSVIETLENMAFMEAVAASGPAQSPISEDRFQAMLPVDAPFKGVLVIRMDGGLARKLAENIYGTPHEELGDQLVRDTVAEILNIVAGRFMTAVLPGEQAYQLGLPSLDQDAAHSPEPARQWLFRSEEEFFAIVIAGDGLLALARSDQ
jgi:CheY-specific phosphatase CheX